MFITMDITYNFFDNPDYPAHKQYEALRAYFYEKLSASEIAKRFGYTENSIYCFASAFKQLDKNSLKNDSLRHQQLVDQQKNMEIIQINLLLH